MSLAVAGLSPEPTRHLIHGSRKYIILHQPSGRLGLQCSCYPRRVLGKFISPLFVDPISEGIGLGQRKGEGSEVSGMENKGFVQKWQRPSGVGISSVCDWIEFASNLNRWIGDLGVMIHWWMHPWRFAVYIFFFPALSRAER